MSIKYKDYYDVLGVSRDADETAIRRAYRKLARQNHPDVNKEAGAKERFQEISEAYEVLGDAKKRVRYDQLGEHWQQGQEFTPPPEWKNVHFKFSSNGGERGFGFSGRGGFSDFFESIFSDMMGDPGSFQSAKHFQSRPPRRTHDEVQLQLTLEEAFLGGTKRIKVLAQGARQPKTYDLTIPAGIRNGAKLRLRNQGQNGGDLLVCMTIARHPRFKVNGADLETTFSLAPHQAVLGAKVGLQLIDGRATLNVPPGTRHGARFKLACKGLKKTGGERGDLYAIAEINVPQNISDREKQLYEQLAALSANKTT